MVYFIIGKFDVVKIDISRLDFYKLDYLASLNFFKKST